jgi:16S rRNA (guanine527-N7)-methyltransferase
MGGQDLGSPLRAWLAEAQQRGFIGPGDLAPHVAHAQGFIEALAAASPPERVVELGSGGGLPALVLAELWPATSFWLVESNQRRLAFLEEAVTDLAWTGRVMPLAGRAEEIAREPHLRASMDLATARGFGAPAVTAECGAPFLAVGGHLIVSEPPDVPDLQASSRWPSGGLAELGLSTILIGRAGVAHYAVFEQDVLCDPRYPRRVGIPRKRPLF